MLTNGSGGYEAEKLPEGGNFRWVEQEFKLQIFATEASEVELDFSVWSLPAENRLTLELAGNSTINLPLASSPEKHSLKLKIKPGRNLLTFSSSQPAAYPQDIGLPYQDSRRLAFASGKLRLSL